MNIQELINKLKEEDLVRGKEKDEYNGAYYVIQEHLNQVKEHYIVMNSYDFMRGAIWMAFACNYITNDERENMIDELFEIETGNK